MTTEKEALELQITPNRFDLFKDTEVLRGIIKTLKEKRIRVKHLNKRFSKSNLKTDFINGLNLIIDNISETIGNIEKTLEEIDKYSSFNDNYYTYDEELLVKKGPFPVVWLFHGGFMGGRGVVIKHSQNREKTYPIILEDYKKLEQIKRELTRDDVNPAIKRFKELDFNQKQRNYANCYNEHLKADTERRLKLFEERITKLEKIIAFNK